MKCTVLTILHNDCFPILDISCSRKFTRTITSGSLEFPLCNVHYMQFEPPTEFTTTDHLPDSDITTS